MESEPYNEELYFTNRDREIRLNRIAFLKGQLREAASKLEYWRQQEEKIYRMIEKLEES